MSSDNQFGAFQGQVNGLMQLILGANVGSDEHIHYMAQMDSLLKIASQFEPRARLQPDGIVEPLRSQHIRAKDFNPSKEELIHNHLHLNYEMPAQPINFESLKSTFLIYVGSRNVPQNQWIRVFAQTYSKSADSEWIHSQFIRPMIDIPFDDFWKLVVAKHEKQNAKSLFAEELLNLKCSNIKHLQQHSKTWAEHCGYLSQDTSTPLSIALWYRSILDVDFVQKLKQQLEILKTTNQGKLPIPENLNIFEFINKVAQGMAESHKTVAIVQPKSNQSNKQESPSQFSKALKTVQAVPDAAVVTASAQETQQVQCSHCQKSGHTVDSCWVLHPAVRPESMKKNQRAPRKSEVQNLQAAWQGVNQHQNSRVAVIAKNIDDTISVKYIGELPLSTQVSDLNITEKSPVLLTPVPAEAHVLDLMSKMRFDETDEAFILPQQHHSISRLTSVRVHDAASIARDHGVDVTTVLVPHGREHRKHLYSQMELLSLETQQVLKCKVMVDTGATLSIVKRYFADRYGLKYVPATGEIFCDFKGVQTSQQYKLTEPLLVVNGSHASEVLFRVVDSDELSDTEPIIIGAPELLPLGIGILGLQATFQATQSQYTTQDLNPWDAPKAELSTPAEVRLTEVETEFIRKEREEIQKLLVENNQQNPPHGQTSHPAAMFSIRLKDGCQDKMRFQKPYTYDADCQAALNLQMSQWREYGWIKEFSPTPERPTPPCCSRMVVASQILPDGSRKFRVCFAGVWLNEITEPFNYPMPSTHPRFTVDHKVFSTIDLKSCFMQYPLDPESQLLTTVLWNGNYFYFTRAIFGTLNITAHNQMVIQNVLSNVIPFPSVAESFVDDIHIGSQSINFHGVETRAVIKRLTDTGFRINIPKCNIFQFQVKLLGRIHGQGYTQADPEKLDFIRDFIRPTSVDDLHTFICFCQYLAEYVRNFATLVGTLRQAVLSAKERKYKRIEWTLQLISDFEKVKEAFASIPTLRTFDAKKLVAVLVDSSISACGGVLFQPDKVGDFPSPTNIILMYSKAFTKAEAARGSYGCEFLGCIKVLDHFHNYLVGRHFYIMNDNIALQYIFSNPKPNRFTMANMYKMCQYSFSLMHVRGSAMEESKLCDYMSRAHKSCWDDDDNENVASCVRDFFHNPDNQEFICSVVQNYVSQPIVDLLALKCPESEAHAVELIKKAHLWGHFGIRSTKKRLSLLGWDMSNFQKHISEEVDSCERCQQWTLSTARFAKLRHTTPNLPFDVFCFDLLTGLPTTERGMKGIFVGMCRLTGFCVLRSFEDKDSAKIIWMLYNIFADFGFPRQFVSDNEPTLVSEIMEAFRQDFNIAKRVLVAYNPRSNGAVESKVKVVSTLVHKFLRDDPNWDITLPLVQLMINDHVRENYDQTPFYSMFSRDHDALLIPQHIPLSEDFTSDFDHWLQRQNYVVSIERPWLRAYINLRANKAAAHFEKKHKLGDLDPLKPGTMVMVKDVNRESKNDSPYIGPFSILSFEDNSQSYALVDSTGSHFNRRVTLDMLKIVPLARKLSDDEYEVEYLMNHKKVNGQYQYQIKWKGFNEPTWESANNILDDNLIRRYWSQKNNSKLKKKS